MLENLIDNGIKFTETGGITIEVRAIAADPSTVTLSFAIIDTGIGIDPESRLRLSVPFTQADSSLSRRFEGAGLGLAICRRLVALMGGTLAVDSTPGAGSTVSFSIRARRASAARPAARADVDGPLPALRLRVLLAEDNPTNRHVATRMLTRMGHTVDAVDDGARAISAAAEADYDVILMDMMMPEVDGLDRDPRDPGRRAAAPRYGDHRPDRQCAAVGPGRLRSRRHERLRDQTGHVGPLARGAGASRRVPCRGAGCRCIGREHLGAAAEPGASVPHG